MTTIRTDLTIVGSGFAGSILALLARRLGLGVALLERGRHPRFALGESTTPLANLILSDLARRYRLPGLFARTSYGRWKAARTVLPVGLKRGFTFLRHREGEPLSKDPSANLFVEASDRDDAADVQWLRADLDAHLASEAADAGAVFLDGFEASLERLDGAAVVAGTRGGERIRIESRLLVDASGEGGFLAGELGLEAVSGGAARETIYGHFLGVERLDPLLADAGLDPSPYVSDDAAVHHIFDDGWMWHLRFDHGLTSAGFVLPADVPAGGNPTTAWRERLSRYPALQTLFGGATPVGPILRKTGLVRRRAVAAGPSWLLLPHAAYFVDPLLSGGIPHSVLVLERLARLLERGLDHADLPNSLQRLGLETLAEAEGLERLVEGCYRSFPRFDLFTTFVMNYFVAASSLEAPWRRGDPDEAAGFLRMRDARFRAVLDESLSELDRLLASGGDAASFESNVARRLGPWNREGFCDTSKGNVYRSPIRPEERWDP